MEKSRKILIFSTAYYPFVGGAEVAIKEITDRISDTRFDLITAKFNRSFPKFERIGNINVYRLGIGIPIIDKLLLPFWGAIKAIRLNQKNNYDYYFCVMVTFASGAAYIANILSSKKVPIILNLQEGDSESHLRYRWLGLTGISWKLALKKASMVTAISVYLAERAKRLGYKGDIKIIPNGVDIEKFSEEISKEEKIKVRKDLTLKDQDIGLVTLSRLVLKNGVGDVIKSLVDLPIHVKFVVFGEGHLNKELEKLAKDLKVSERVLFKGYVSHLDIPKYLKACDIFIRASLSEGMGNAFIEAMASKIPVIGTRVGGIVDFLKEGETGYFCQPENPESTTQAVKKVISDPDKNQIVENAYKMVKERYDWNLIALQMKEVFDKTNKLSI